jgi:hypothetical protein
MAEFPTSSPGERLQMEFTSAVADKCFANFAGDQCTIGEIPAGITDTVYADGDFGSVIISGTALLTIKASLAQGAQIMPNADGFGILATTGNYVGAIAKFAGVTDANIEVLLTRYKI